MLYCYILKSLKFKEKIGLLVIFDYYFDVNNVCLVYIFLRLELFIYDLKFVRLNYNCFFNVFVYYESLREKMKWGCLVFWFK